jgi:hypothetical protein
MNKERKNKRNKELSGKGFSGEDLDKIPTGNKS